VSCKDFTGVFHLCHTRLPVRMDDVQEGKATAGRRVDGEGDAHGHGHGRADDCCHHSHGHGVQEHSLSSGAGEKENPVAALPGLVLAPGMVKAVVAFMEAEAPEQVG